MPNEVDPQDPSFIEGMKKLLGYDDDEVNTLLSQLSADESIELADAVNSGDKLAATAIIQNASVDKTADVRKDMINPLFDKSNVQEDTDAEESNGPKLGADVSLNIGDAVIVAGKNATVKIPQGPGGTVGLMMGGKLKMVDRREIDRVDEAMMGMSMMPSMDRIRELAGIRPVEQQGGSMVVQPETEEVLVPPAVTVSEPASNPVDCAMAALDQFEGAMMNIKLGDLKAIRARLTNVMMKMNEGISVFTDKKPVVETRKLKRS